MRDQYIVKLRIGRRVFAPGLAATLVTLLLLPGLVSLGFWQLRRAAEKRELMAQAEQGRQQLVALDFAQPLPRYQHVRVRGRYDSSRQIFLDNMPSNAPSSAASTQGQPGYWLLTPLLIDSMSAARSAVILVNRGWLPVGVDRQVLPEVSVSGDVRELRGLLDDLPQPGLRAGVAGIQADRWPQLLNYPTLDELQQVYGPGLLPRIMLLDADQADGYQRVWPITVGLGPERHVGYAVQWFGLALTLLIIYVVVNLRREVSEGVNT